MVFFPSSKQVFWNPFSTWTGKRWFIILICVKRVRCSSLLWVFLQRSWEKWSDDEVKINFFPRDYREFASEAVYFPLCSRSRTISPDLLHSSCSVRNVQTWKSWLFWHPNDSFAISALFWICDLVDIIRSANVIMTDKDESIRQRVHHPSRRFGLAHQRVDSSQLNHLLYHAQKKVLSVSSELKDRMGLANAVVTDRDESVHQRERERTHTHRQSSLLVIFYTVSHMTAALLELEPMISQWWEMNQ